MNTKITSATIYQRYKLMKNLTKYFIHTIYFTVSFYTASFRVLTSNNYPTGVNHFVAVCWSILHKTSQILL